MTFPLRGKRVFVTGHQGMVGSAIVRRLSAENCEVLTTPRSNDLRDHNVTLRVMLDASPNVVIHAAGKVGGIVANRDNPVDFLRDNALMAINVIDAAGCANVERLVFLGSSCIYPREAAQPIPEDALLSGALEPTNESYAIAKIAGVKFCDAYFRQRGRLYNSLMPTNLYGPATTIIRSTRMSRRR
jgi:GDP-L-fucose synthase